MYLSFEGVSFSYNPPTRAKGKASQQAAWGNDPESMWALRDITFRVEQGDFLGIAGHTGSGKSTLLQHMNGLVQPTAGRVLFDGEDLAQKSTRKTCRSHVGIVFQYPERQLFATTVYDDIAFGPRNMKLASTEVDERVRLAMQQVGLDFDTIATMSPFELSGGQQRRVAFAGVLAMKPEVLVLDEPAAGLDPEARENFLDLVRDLHQRGLTVVMVSHCMEDLARLCTRILVLNQGRILTQGTPAEVFSRAAELHAVGLDVPAAQRMADKLRQHGFAIPQRLYATPDDLASALAELTRCGNTDSPRAADSPCAADNPCAVDDPTQSA